MTTTDRDGNHRGELKFSPRLIKNNQHQRTYGGNNVKFATLNIVRSVPYMSLESQQYVRLTPGGVNSPGNGASKLIGALFHILQGCGSENFPHCSAHFGQRGSLSGQ